MHAPLHGIRVLDLGALCKQHIHAIAASMTAKLCAGYGATVVRSTDDEGEPLRTAEPRLPGRGSALDTFLNGGKRHAGSGPFQVAIGDSTTLAVHATDIPVKVRISVYGAGEDPPMSELSLAAASGFLDMVGEAGGPPTRLPGHQLAYAAGLSATSGLFAALYAGGDETVDVSLFDVAVWLNWKAPASFLRQGVVPTRGSASNYWRVLPAKDGYVALVYQEKDWPALRDMIGDPRLSDDRFSEPAGRADHIEALLSILRPWFELRTREEITADAQNRRIPIGPVLLPNELLKDPQYRSRGAFHPDGTPRLPLLWDGKHIDRENDEDID